MTELMCFYEFSLNNWKFLESYVLISTDLQNWAVISNLEKLFRPERNDLSVGWIIWRNFIISDDLMFFNFPDEFGVFCFFESHVKDSSGLNLFSFKADFLRQELPRKFVLWLWSWWWFALNLYWLTTGGYTHVLNIFGSQINKFQRLLNAFYVFAWRWCRNLWILSTR